MTKEGKKGDEVNMQLICIASIPACLNLIVAGRTSLPVISESLMPLAPASGWVAVAISFKPKLDQ